MALLTAMEKCVGEPRGGNFVGSGPAGERYEVVNLLPALAAVFPPPEATAVMPAVIRRTSADLSQPHAGQLQMV